MGAGKKKHPTHGSKRKCPHCGNKRSLVHEWRGDRVVTLKCRGCGGTFPASVK